MAPYQDMLNQKVCLNLQRMPLSGIQIKDLLGIYRISLYDYPFQKALKSHHLTPNVGKITTRTTFKTNPITIAKTTSLNLIVLSLTLKSVTLKSIIFT